MRAPRHGEQTIIPLWFAFALLLDLENTDDTARDDKAGKSCRVMDHHDVERVAVISLGRRHEPPIMRIGQPGKKSFVSENVSIFGS